MSARFACWVGARFSHSLSIVHTSVITESVYTVSHMWSTQTTDTQFNEKPKLSFGAKNQFRPRQRTLFHGVKTVVLARTYRLVVLATLSSLPLNAHTTTTHSLATRRRNGFSIGKTRCGSGRETVLPGAKTVSPQTRSHVPLWLFLTMALTQEENDAVLLC